jgi:hypothetical protein
MQHNDARSVGQWQGQMDAGTSLSPLAARVVPFRTAIHRAFTVEVPLNVAWDHLANIECWPSWAQHIKRVEISPSGPVTDRSTGILRVKQGGKLRFRTTEYRFLRHWIWRGHAYGIELEYGHRFEAVAEHRTQITFVVGYRGSSLLGRFFSGLYARNLDRAIPSLIAELNRRAGIRHQ